MDGYYKSMKAKVFDIEAGKLISVINDKDAKELGLFPMDRIEIINPKNKKFTHTVVDVSATMVSTNNIGIFKDVQKELDIKSNQQLDVKPEDKPESIEFIKKKMRGERLSFEQIKRIVDDINNNVLSDVELSAFMTAVYIKGFDLEETISMTKSLISTGKQIKIDASPVVDKHSIGGTNGRATMIAVPIVAAFGCYVPKTSSKAITSASGTADAMEVLADVNMSADKIKQTTEKVGGVIVWGGSVDLAPTDDKIIKVEHPLSLDPEGQVVASVMAKKASVGSKYLVIDLPVGPEVKIKTRESAESMALRFIEVGRILGMKVECIITDGSEPCGLAFGPALEAKYAMEVLEGKIFDNLAQKSCEIAGAIFELTEKTPKGKGYEKAKEILESGKALQKMKEIIKAQNGKIFSSEEIMLSDIVADYRSKEKGKIKIMNVRLLTKIARTAGAPADKKAGILLKKRVGDEIKEGDIIFEIYAENKRKLMAAKEYAERNPPIEVEKIVFEKYGG